MTFFSVYVLPPGLVLTMDTQYLVTQDRNTLTVQLMYSSMFLTVQVVFLAQFTPFCSWSMVLLLADVAYRLYQCVKLAYYWALSQIPNIRGKQA